MPNNPQLLDWLEPHLERAAALVNDPTPVAAPEALYLGIDLGTSDVVTMAVDSHGMPVAVCLDCANVVRDGVVLAFFEAVEIVKSQVAQIEAKGIDRSEITPEMVEQAMKENVQAIEPAQDAEIVQEY